MMPMESSLLDGSAPFYNVYTCEDGGWMSVGCLEPQFFKTFITIFVTALPPDFDPHNGWKPSPEVQFKRDQWPKLTEYITKGFLTSPRDFWAGVFHGMWSWSTWTWVSLILYINLETDACAVPVLTPQEAGKLTSNIPIFHPQVSKQPNVRQYSDSKSIVIQPGLHTDAVLQDFGFDAGRIKRLKEEGVLGKDSRRVSSKLWGRERWLGFHDIYSSSLWSITWYNVS